MNQTICAIEHFGFEPHDGAERLRLEGWFLSNSARDSVTLILGGPGGTAFDVTDLERSSADVFHYHSDTFGPSASNARFLLVLVDMPGMTDLHDATLRTVFVDGTVMVHVLSGPARAGE